MSMVSVDYGGGWWRGPQDPAVRCRWCGWANGLVLDGGEFVCRDVERCARWMRATWEAEELGIRYERREIGWVSSHSRSWTL